MSAWLIAMLLFTQLATAAYVCPLTSATQAAAAIAPMPGCDGNMGGAMDPDQPQLCQVHCQQGSQTVHPTPASDAPTTPMLLAVLDWTMDLVLPAQSTGQAIAMPSGASPPGSPPRYLSLLVLRN